MSLKAAHRQLRVIHKAAKPLNSVMGQPIFMPLYP